MSAAVTQNASHPKTPNRNPCEIPGMRLLAGKHDGSRRVPRVGARLALELFELANALQLHQDDQALELGAIHVIAGSGAEIQGYAKGDRTSPRQIRSEV
jgi:hypothetical protein